MVQLINPEENILDCYHSTHFTYQECLLSVIYLVQSSEIRVSSNCVSVYILIVETHGNHVLLRDSSFVNRLCAHLKENTQYVVLNCMNKLTDVYYWQRRITTSVNSLQSAN